MEANTDSNNFFELDAFLNDKTSFLNKVLNTLGWSKGSLDKKVHVQCPVDLSHWMPESSISSHIESCLWRNEGYPADEKEKQPPSSYFFYEKTPIVPIKISKENQANILVGKGLLEKNCLEKPPPVPKTVDRSTVDLTQEQRLALYDYVVEKAKSTCKQTLTVEDLMLDFEKKDEQSDKPKSKLEILAEQRDYKRRRQSYRAKNVHITKKSYTEIMKEVIENQMSYLTEMRNQESIESPKQPNTSSNKAKEDVLSESSYEEHHKSRKYSHKHHSRSPHSKRKKHKYDRSRSRSSTRKHKKSKHKHKKNKD